MDNILANVLGAHQLRNLRVAETEKFAHVTYFFNGGIEVPFPGEERIMCPSLKVATYDLAPEMRAEASATPSSRPSTTPPLTSLSPTSPTPTWSATPASLSPPSAPARQ